MTSREFAKFLGVSQSTVSRALNDSTLVPQEKREFIKRKAKEHGFALNSQAISLRTRRTNTIGVLFPRHFIGMSHNLMLAQIYDRIQEEMEKYGYDTMVINYKSEKDDFSSFERIIRNRKVDGFFVLRMELSDVELKLINEYNSPCVFIMNAGAKTRANLNWLFSDSEYSGYAVGNYLGAFKEWQKIFVTVNEEREDAERRLRGYRKGLAEHGGELLDDNILQAGLSIEEAYKCIYKNKEKLIHTKTAIFAYSDTLAIGIINACKDLGLQIPHQVQIVGMDDISIVRGFQPRISTMHAPVDEMVERGGKILMDLLDGNEVLVQEWLKATMILRDTTLPLDYITTSHSKSDNVVY